MKVYVIQIASHKVPHYHKIGEFMCIYWVHCLTNLLEISVRTNSMVNVLKTSFVLVKYIIVPILFISNHTKWKQDRLIFTRLTSHKKFNCSKFYCDEISLLWKISGAKCPTAKVLTAKNLHSEIPAPKCPCDKKFLGPNSYGKNSWMKLGVHLLVLAGEIRRLEGGSCRAVAPRRLWRVGVVV